MNIRNFKKDLFFCKLNKTTIQDKFLVTSAYTILSSSDPEYIRLGFSNKEDLQNFKKNPLQYVKELQESSMIVNIKDTARILAKEATKSEILYLLEEDKVLTEKEKQQLEVRFYDYYLEILLEIKTVTK